jgi:hypothetical protein
LLEILPKRPIPIKRADGEFKIGNKHRWPSNLIPAGLTYADQNCLDCGIRRRLYRSGTCAYFDGHMLTPKKPHGCLAVKTSKEIPEPEILIINTPIPEKALKKVKLYEPPQEENLPPLTTNVPIQAAAAPILHEFEWQKVFQAAVRKNNLHKADTLLDNSTIQELLVLVNLMFEDMIKQDINTTSRRMAGKFIYSEKYQEISKQLDKSGH